MQTIKINVSDSIYAHVMFFLKSLKSKNLEIVEDTNSMQEKNNKKRREFGLLKDKKLEAFSQTAGILKNREIDPIKWQREIRSDRKI